MPLGIHPIVDFVFKLLFGDDRNTDLLIHLLNAVLQHEHPIVEVIILNPYNDKEFDDDKLSIVDIKAKDSSGTLFIIEIQTTLPTGLRNRQIYYTCGLYHSQMREGGSYRNLRPAISVCFLNGSLFPSIPDGHLSFSLHDPLHAVSLGDQLQLHLVELVKYNVSEADLLNATDLERWTFFFANAHRLSADELCQLLPYPSYQKATGIIEMISREPDLRMFYDDRAKAELDKYSFAKDALAEKNEAIAEAKIKAIAEGLAEGRAKGLAEGLAEGRAEGETRGKLIGRIQLLHELLAMNATDAESLSKMDESTLATLAEDLQDRLQNPS